MKVSMLIIIIAVMFLNAAEALEGTREVGSGISNTISIFTGGGSNSTPTEVSNSFALNTILGQSGYGISDAVFIDTALPAVTNLSIEKQVTGFHLAWLPAEGATSYKIYRGNRPYLPLVQMQLLGETSETSWWDVTANNANKNFYVIITVGQ